MDHGKESRAKMHEADALVQQVVALANPSRPTVVQNIKTQQAQQLKFAIAGNNKFELEKCVSVIEETTASSQRRLEELEPKSAQLVSLVKFIKDALVLESEGMANSVKFEEERLADAQRELVEVMERIINEKREMQQSIEKAKNQLLQMDLTLQNLPDETQMIPEEEATIAREEENLRIWEDKLARLVEIAEQNNHEFLEKHNTILREIVFSSFCNFFSFCRICAGSHRWNANTKPRKAKHISSRKREEYRVGTDHKGTGKEAICS
eukprot:Phypoly_transcript_08263.p1 GENE.Phypoly_transcript_08263~~Phypoly_transcript_08263.p1  ORF type:complete len:266 (+),score=67.43 Phypoly_transcript_08263:685-1482(+)